MNRGNRTSATPCQGNGDETPTPAKQLKRNDSAEDAEESSNVRNGAKNIEYAPDGKNGQSIKYMRTKRETSVEDNTTMLSVEGGKLKKIILTPLCNSGSIAGTQFGNGSVKETVAYLWPMIDQRVQSTSGGQAVGNKDLERQLIATNKLLTKARSDLEKIKKNEEENKNKLDAMENMEVEYQRQIAELDTEKAQLQGENAKLSVEVTKLKNERSLFEETVAECEEQYEIELTKIEKLLIEYSSDYQLERQRRKTEKKRCIQLEKIVEKLERMLQVKMAAIDQYEKQLKDKEEENASLRMALMGEIRMSLMAFKNPMGQDKNGASALPHGFKAVPPPFVVLPCGSIAVPPPPFMVLPYGSRAVPPAGNVPHGARAVPPRPPSTVLDQLPNDNLWYAALTSANGDIYALKSNARGEKEICWYDRVASKFVNY